METQSIRGWRLGVHASRPRLGDRRCDQCGIEQDGSAVVGAREFDESGLSFDTEIAGQLLGLPIENDTTNIQEEVVRSSNTGSSRLPIASRGASSFGVKSSRSILSCSRA